MSSPLLASIAVSHAASEAGARTNPRQHRSASTTLLPHYTAGRHGRVVEWVHGPDERHARYQGYFKAIWVLGTDLA